MVMVDTKLLALLLFMILIAAFAWWKSNRLL